MIGLVNAAIFWLFEQIVNKGTDKLWDGIFKSNTHRWVVLPLAIVMSILFSWMLKALHQNRVITPKLSSLEQEHNMSKVTLATIGVILLVGVAALLAGASLGPEAALVTSSSAIGVWFAAKMRLGKQTELMTTASVGALLVAFFGSILLVLAPIFLLYKQKRLGLHQIIIVLLAGVSSYVGIWLITPHNPGYGTIPTTTKLGGYDFIMAIALGFVTVFVAYILKRYIGAVFSFSKLVEKRLHWLLAAGLFGLVIGIIYMIGGQTIQFSGSQGSMMLLEQSAQYGAWALAGFALAKLLATGWSIGSGYRGGLIFPSVYMGVALGLSAGHLAGSLGSAGASIGSVSGIISAMIGSPAIGAVVVAALLPAKLMILAVVSIVGTVAGTRLLKRLGSKPKTATKAV